MCPPQPTSSSRRPETLGVRAVVEAVGSLGRRENGGKQNSVVKNATSPWHFLSAIPPPPYSFHSLGHPSPAPAPATSNLGMREGWWRLRGGGTKSGILGDREPSEPEGGGRVRQVSPPLKHHHFGSQPSPM